MKNENLKQNESELTQVSDNDVGNEKKSLLDIPYDEDTAEKQISKYLKMAEKGIAVPGIVYMDKPSLIGPLISEENNIKRGTNVAEPTDTSMDQKYISPLTYDDEAEYITALTYDDEFENIIPFTYDKASDYNTPSIELETNELSLNQGNNMNINPSDMPNVSLEHEMPVSELDKKNHIQEKSNLHNVNITNSICRDIANPGIMGTENEYFQFSNGKLYYGSYDNQVEISNFFLILSQEICTINEQIDATGDNISYNEAYLWSTQIITGTDKYTAKIKGEDIEKLSWIERAAHGKARISFVKNSKKLFLTYLRLLIDSQIYERTFEYTSSGWKKWEDGRYYYVEGCGNVGEFIQNVKGPEKQRLLYQKELLGSKEIFDNIWGMRNIVRNEDNGAILFHYMHLSVMITMFNQAKFKMKFLLGLIGKTNSKKTSVAMIFFKIFNRNQVETPDINFRSTKGAIEEMMACYSDACLIVNDLTPSNDASGKKEQHQKFETLVRGYGDRLSKQRMSGYIPKGGATHYPVNGSCVFTGEVEMGVLSSRSRVVQLDFEAGGTDNALLKYYQENLGIVPTHMYHFIAYLTYNFEKIVQYIRRTASNIRAINGERFGIARYAENYAVFHCVIEIFYEYARVNNFISEYEASSLKEKDLNSVWSILHKNDKAIQEENPAVMFVKAIMACISDKTFTVIRLSEGVDNVGISSHRQTILEDEKYWYIRMEAALECSKRYWKKFDVFFDYDKGRILIPFLKEYNLIHFQIDSKGKVRNSLKLPIQKISNDRFIYLKKEEVNKILNDMILD